MGLPSLASSCDKKFRCLQHAIIKIYVEQTKYAQKMLASYLIDVECLKDDWPEIEICNLLILFSSFFAAKLS